MEKKLNSDIASALKEMHGKSLSYLFSEAVFPPENFEKKYDFKGVSYLYKLPEGLTETDIESYVNTYAGYVFAHSDPDNGKKPDPNDYLAIAFSKGNRGGLLRMTEEELRRDDLTLEELQEIRDRPYPYEGLSAQALSDWKLKQSQLEENMVRLWAELCTLNPALNIIEVDEDNFFALEAAIMGVTSRYNPSDIQQYINNFWGEVSEGSKKKNNALYAEVFKDMDTYGFPSDHSLQIIKKQIATP